MADKAPNVGEIIEAALLDTAELLHQRDLAQQRIGAERMRVAAEREVAKLRFVLWGSPQDYVTHALAAIRSLPPLPEEPQP